MKPVLIDSSVWISFFKGDKKSKPLLDLIDSNLVCVNDLILAELIPSLNHKKEKNLVGLMNTIERLDMNIHWDEIIEMQTLNLKKGINRVGIPDLLILQNAIQHKVKLFTFDRHFHLMAELHGLQIYS